MPSGTIIVDQNMEVPPDKDEKEGMFSVIKTISVKSFAALDATTRGM